MEMCSVDSIHWIRALWWTALVRRASFDASPCTNCDTPVHRVANVVTRRASFRWLVYKHAWTMAVFARIAKSTMSIRHQYSKIQIWFMQILVLQNGWRSEICQADSPRLVSAFRGVCAEDLLDVRSADERDKADRLPNYWSVINN